MTFTSKDISAIKFYSNYQKRDLKLSLEEYHEFIDTLVYLHETLAELKIQLPYWQVFSDTLMTKFFLHSNAFYNILGGSELKSKYFNKEPFNTVILDVPTAQIILRGQIEAFLMYHHIYINPKTDEEKEFHFNVWIYSSLIRRQSFPAENAESNTQKAKDKIEIEKIKIQIRQASSFNSLTNKQQKDLIEKGSDRLFKSWDTLFTDAGFSKNHSFRTLYSVLSSYAHSEGLSILQIKQSQLGYNKNNSQANVILHVSKQLICLMIKEIIKLYKIIEIKFNTLPQELQDTIDIYTTVANRL